MNSRKLTTKKNKKMKEIKNPEEAFAVLRAAQQKILDAAKTYIPFSFIIYTNKEKEINIYVPRDFYMQSIAADSETAKSKIVFVGKSLEEAAQNFLDFFVKGGKVYISHNSDGLQVYVTLAYTDDWSVVKIYVGNCPDRLF